MPRGRHRRAGGNVTVVTYNRIGCPRRMLANLRRLAGQAHILPMRDNAGGGGTPAMLRALQAAGEIDNFIPLVRNLRGGRALQFGLGHGRCRL